MKIAGKVLAFIGVATSVARLCGGDVTAPIDLVRHVGNFLGEAYSEVSWTEIAENYPF